MWPAFLSVSRLPSLSYQLWVAACLASFLPLSLAFYVAVKLRKLNAFVERTQKKKEYLGWKDIALKLASFRPTEIKRTLVIMALASAASFAVMHLSGQQKGYCTSTGDIWHSNDFVIEHKISLNCYLVQSKAKGPEFGKEYNWCTTPQSDPKFLPGTYVEWANFEMRDGFADFTVPGADYKKWESEEAYVQWKQQSSGGR